MRCKGANLAIHSFCGFCGLELPPLRPRDVTHVDRTYSDEITLRRTAPEPSRPILVSSNGTTVRTEDVSAGSLQGMAGDLGFGRSPTKPVMEPPIPFTDDAIAPTDPDSPADTLNQRIEPGRSVQGLCVVLLKGVGSNRTLDAFPLELGEPLDIDGKRFSHKGTFTAVRTGLRLDALGSIGTVYASLDGRIPLLPGRTRRYERTLGTFQEIRVGEILPLRSFAFIDHALIRIDAV